MRRLKSGPAPWHVIARGARRLDLFRDEQDYAEFSGLLGFSIRRSGCELWSYALMPNHYHMTPFGSSDQLTGCMRRLNTLYSTYHNRRYGLEGHAFDGPYLNYRQDSKFFLLRTMAYVFQNPVVGRLADRPGDYPWSGYRSFIGEPGSPIPVDAAAAMKFVSSDTRFGWREFYEAIEREGRRIKPALSGVPKRLDVHRMQFGWLLEQARAAREGLKRPDGETLAIYWGRNSGIARSAMADILGWESREVGDRYYGFKRWLTHHPQALKNLGLT